MSPLTNYRSIHFPVSVNHVAQERSDGCDVKQHDALKLLLQTETNIQSQSVAGPFHPLNPIRKSQYHLLCMTAALFWVITQRVVVIVSGQPLVPMVRGRESKRIF